MTLLQLAVVRSRPWWALPAVVTCAGLLDPHLATAQQRFLPPAIVDEFENADSITDAVIARVSQQDWENVASTCSGHSTAGRKDGKPGYAGGALSNAHTLTGANLAQAPYVAHIELTAAWQGLSAGTHCIVVWRERQGAQLWGLAIWLGTPYQTPKPVRVAACWRPQDPNPANNEWLRWHEHDAVHCPGIDEHPAFKAQYQNAPDPNRAKTNHMVACFTCSRQGWCSLF